MDGVLLDSEPLHYRALSGMLASEGYAWTEEDNGRLLGTTVADSFRIIHETVPLAKPVEAYLSLYDTVVLEILQGALDPSRGVRELLDELGRAGFPVAVASSSRRSWIDATLRSLALAAHF